MDAQFEVAVAKVTKGAANPLDASGHHHPSQRPASREDLTAFRAAYCLLGKDWTRVAALCQKLVRVCQERAFSQAGLLDSALRIGLVRRPDGPRIRWCCPSLQIPEVESLWATFRGASDCQLCTNLDQPQRSRLASSLISRLAYEGGDSTTGTKWAHRIPFNLGHLPLFIIDHLNSQCLRCGTHY